MKNKDKIAEAAFLLSLKYGFDNVSIKQIQDEANVTTGAIYYHFKDKNDILDYILKKYVVNEIKNFKNELYLSKDSFFEKLEFIFFYFTKYAIENNQNAIKVLHENDIDIKQYYLMQLGIYHQHPEFRKLYNEVSQDILDLFKELINEAKKNNEIKEDLDVDDSSIYIFTIFRGIIRVWSIFIECSLEDLIKININMVRKTLEWESSHEILYKKL